MRGIWNSGRGTCKLVFLTALNQAVRIWHVAPTVVSSALFLKVGDALVLDFGDTHEFAAPFRERGQQADDGV